MNYFIIEENVIKGVQIVDQWSQVNRDDLVTYIRKPQLLQYHLFIYNFNVACQEYL